jgi:predicted AAA+ superfamily ATPase
LGLKFSANSFYNYLQYLEEAFIIFPVYFFSKSNAIKNRNPMKIYCIDWALALAVMPGGELDVTRRLENMVFLELKRRGYDVYYYKTLKDHEIDFIAVSKRDKSKILIQVCYSIEKSDVRERETRGIAETCEFLKINNAQIITANEEDSINLKSVTVKVSPFWKWALEK